MSNTDLLHTLASASLSAPLVKEVDTTSPAKRHWSAEAEEQEEETAYWASVHQVLTSMQDDIRPFRSNSVVAAIGDALQTLQKKVASVPSTASPPPSPPASLQSIVRNLQSPFPPVRAFSLTQLENLVRTSSVGGGFIASSQ